MLTVREVEYTTEKNPEQVFSTLKWAVEQVDSIFGQLLTNITVDTSKNWIGTINEENLKFSLISPSGILNPKFFQIILSAKLKQVNSQSHLNLKIQLGWFTALTFIFIYAATLLNLFFWITTNQHLNGVAGLVGFLIIFPGFGTFILIRKIKNLEQKFEQLLDLK